MVQPGEYFYRETGAVWFTVKATINMDNKPQIDIWDAIWPIAAIIAGAALAFVTVGSSAALSASVAAGGAAGSVSGTVVAAIASTLVGMGMKAGTALCVTTSAIGATQAVVTSAGVTLAVKEALYQDLSGVQSSWMSVSDAGTYAGYPWPFEQETQTARVHGGLHMESAHLDNQCVNVFRQDTSSNLKLSCVSGACFLG